MKQALLVGAICALPFFVFADPADPATPDKIIALLQDGEVEEGLALAEAQGYIVVDDIIVIHLVDPRSGDKRTVRKSAKEARPDGQSF